MRLFTPAWQKQEFISSDNYFRDFNEEEVDIKKLIDDNNLMNDIALSNREELWGNPKDYHYDINKDNKKYDIIYASREPNGRLRLANGRHRVRALYNDGYDKIKIPVRNLK